MSNREPIFNVPTSVMVCISLLVLVHIVRTLLPDEQNLQLLLVMAFIPARYDAVDFPIPGGDISAVTSFVTYMFVHGDVVHLTVNSIWLLAFGSAIARRVGNLRFFLFSLFCGVAGVLTHLVFRWGDITPVIGASAAVSGQMAGAMRFFFGAYKSGEFWRIGHDPKSVPRIGVIDALKDYRILVFLLVWLALNLLFGLGGVNIGNDSVVAWEAHIGGFFAGLLAFSLFDDGYRTKSQ